MSNVRLAAEANPMVFVPAVAFVLVDVVVLLLWPCFKSKCILSMTITDLTTLPVYSFSY